MLLHLFDHQQRTDGESFSLQQFRALGRTPENCDQDIAETAMIEVTLANTDIPRTRKPRRPCRVKCQVSGVKNKGKKRQSASADDPGPQDDRSLIDR